MSNIRVLIVDDFDLWRQHARSILESVPELGVIGEACDGLEALQKAEMLKPDLILLDIGLPHLNGVETENRLRRVLPAAKVIFLTQNNDPDIVRAALSNGTLAYVLKTDAGTELLPAIKAILRGENFVSSGITSCDSNALAKSNHLPLREVIDPQ